MPILYRFMGPAAGLLSLEFQRLRVGRFSNLNDPFDCSPQFVTTTEKERAVTEDIMKNIFHGERARLGLLCFSLCWDEPLLWSHYADSHRGMALVFDHPDAADDLFYVDYAKTRPVVHFRSMIAPTNYEDAINAAIDALRVKSPSWAYEKEVRVIMDLPTCTLFDGHYYTSLQSRGFLGVILGLRCPHAPSDIRRIYEEHCWTDAKIWVARKSDTMFLIERDEVR